MRVQYNGARAKAIPRLGCVVDPGGVVDAPTEVAESLLADPDWSKPAGKKKSEEAS